MIKMHRLFFEATRLDIYDLAFECSSEALNLIPYLQRKGIFTRIGVFLWHFLKSSIGSWGRLKKSITPCSIIFFPMNKNEKDSIEPICLEIPQAYLINRDNSLRDFPWFWSYALSFFYFPLVLFHFFNATGFKRRTFSYIIDHYWTIYGLYIISRVWLRYIKPKALVMSNHINTPNRVLIKAAHEEKVITIFIQHASLPDKKTPLNFDYALLEGYDALSKLDYNDVTTKKIFLIGIPKYDFYKYKINMCLEVSAIGICVNQMDPLDRVEQLCAFLMRQHPNLQMFLRPHIGDIRQTEWKELSIRYGLKFSNSKNELSFEFLKKVDVIIAGDSNILLEAALMNIYPIYYDFSQTHLDWYGFKRNGLVEYFVEPKDLYHAISIILKSKPSIRIKAKRYCSTIGTHYDGRSSELASVLIQALVSGNQINWDEWKRIPGIKLEAYELNDDGDRL